MGYTVVGWLDKNKDPLNDSVIGLFKNSTDPFVIELWEDYLLEGERPRGKKGASFITMGQVRARQKTLVNKDIYFNNLIDSVQLIETHNTTRLELNNEKFS